MKRYNKYIGYLTCLAIFFNTCYLMDNNVDNKEKIM